MVFLKTFALAAIVVGTYYSVRFLYDLAYAKLLVETSRTMATIKPGVVEAAF